MQTYNSLADLDELFLACRDHRAKAYLTEAIASYKAGAYRSSIVSTWVAVCFDFIEKVHELALSGDKEAEQLSAEINGARARGDLTWALKFEKTILVTARDKFELISPLEFVDLERLQEDRNRCAHPSLASDGEPFMPSAELARLHIRSSVTHFLQHPPVQGKAALDRLKTEVESNYFPTDSNKAVVAFSSGPLKRPRKSLIANFVMILLKRAIADDTAWEFRVRAISALKAVRLMHEMQFDELATKRLSNLIRNAKDKSIGWTLYLITDVPVLWEFLEADVKQRLQLYVDGLPIEEFELLESLYDFVPLKTNVERRISRASVEDLKNVGWFQPPKPAISKFIDAYVKSTSFEQANSLALELRICGRLIDREQIEKIVVAAANNGEIAYSFGFPSVLTSISRSKNISKLELEKLLIENSLERFVPVAE